MGIIRDGLLEPYWISCEERQYIVKKDTGKVDKNQKSITENMGYYSNRFEALKKIADLQINSNDKVFKVSEYFQEYNNTIRELIRVIGE